MAGVTKDEDDLVVDFREGIRMLLAVTGTPLVDAARLAGLSDNYFTRFLMRSTKSNPNLKTLSGLSKVFDMSIEDVVSYGRACNVARLQLIGGGQEEILERLLYFKKENK